MPSMPAMAMPSMPSMPAMPSIPSIPGLRKSGAADGAEGAEGAADVSAAGAVSGGDDDDKSRYIRYGPLLKNDGIIYILNGCSETKSLLRSRLFFQFMFFTFDIIFSFCSTKSFCSFNFLWQLGKPFVSFCASSQLSLTWQRLLFAII